MQPNRLNFQKGDVAAIVLVALLAAGVFLAFLPKRSQEAAQAEIYLNSERIETIQLSQNRVFTITGQYSNTITVEDGRIAITASDCPGGDCVHSGWVSSSGRSIVCLPNGLEIRVVAKTDDVDFVVG